jgi:hypothetical protein
MCRLYSVRSICALGACTAAPFERLRTAKWIPALSRTRVREDVFDSTTEHGRTSDLSHDAVQRIDLAHKRAFPNASDARVAAQLANSIQAVCEESSARSGAGCTCSRFAACMSTTDDYDCERTKS